MICVQGFHSNQGKVFSMKKVIFVLALAFAIHSIPSKASAVITETPGGLVAFAVLGIATMGDKADAKTPATGNEFVDLNNNKAIATLLDQKAGGSLNTLDILK